MPNQHKPLPPEVEIRESIEFYYHLNLDDPGIATQMKDHYDTEKYGLSVSSIKRLCQKWGLKSTRQQAHTLESIAEAIQNILQQYPSRGAEMIRKQLRVELNMQVPRPLIMCYLNQTEPDAVKARRRRRFKRRRFYAAGVNDIWAMDQHDKWGPRFGLWLHNGIDPFIGINNWLKVWWTNKNPRLIAKFFLDHVRKYGAIPLTTQSDPGLENYGIANIQTHACHELDPSLVGTLQHRWKRNKMNVKSEANWSVFRRDFAPGYEDLFESGVNAGYYNVDDILENLVFRWLAIPWLQSELDKWVIVRNRTPPRANTKKVLPHGIPELMREKPEQFGALDFKIPVPTEFIDRLEAEFAPPDHPVFQLMPPLFNQRASAFYSSIGSPMITFHTFWDTYHQLLHCFHQDLETDHDEAMASLISSQRAHTQEVEEDSIPLMEGLRELRQGDQVVGAYNHDGDGSDYASFTDDSDKESEGNT